MWLQLSATNKIKVFSKLYVELEFTFGPMIGEFFAVPLLAGLDKPNLKKTSMKLV